MKKKTFAALVLITVTALFLWAIWQRSEGLEFAPMVTVLGGILFGVAGLKVLMPVRVGKHHE